MRFPYEASDSVLTSAQPPGPRVRVVPLKIIYNVQAAETSQPYGPLTANHFLDKVAPLLSFPVSARSLLVGRVDGWLNEGVKHDLPYSIIVPGMP
jgi:hypothetical protein